MTTVLFPNDIASILPPEMNDTIIDSQGNFLLVDSSGLKNLITYLHNTRGLELDYLNDITAVDYWDYFELVYTLTSLKHNKQVTIKTRVTGRDNTRADSITSIYKGAENQEREIHDLMGITFEGHPNMNPLVLWEGFQGYPLRKDYL
jgi:NADH-quinone oxidoreductase subunit C